MRRLFLIGAAALTLAGQALGQPAPVGGYLATGDAPDAVRLLPAPPPSGSGREADDEAIFKATRALQGQPRWALATADADLRPEPGLAAFACAIGLTLDAQNAPTLVSIFHRTAIDAAAVINPPKDRYKRPRPFVAEPEAPICVDKTEGLAESPSYPSGHATQSWAWGLILAELAPDSASDILMRARSIGESRIVCGVHYLSDVQAGRDAGAALVARLHADPAFRADMEKAELEVDAARRTPHVGPEGCLDQDQAAAHPPY